MKDEKRFDADAAIVGAGPCGLFQVFELGLYGLSSLVIDALPQVGGQCIQLYPNKPIYDIPALPTVMAETLINNLLEQIKPFTPQFILGQRIIECERLINDEGFILSSHSGHQYRVKAVVIASGAGAMVPVPLKVGGSEPYISRHIFYGVKDPAVHKGKRVAVLGGGDSALDWAIELQKHASEVVLIHRSDRFKAAPKSVQSFKQLCDEYLAQLIVGQVTGLVVDHERFMGLKITGSDHLVRQLSIDHIIVCFGMVPDQTSLSAWQFNKQKTQALVSTATFETSTPGIFAVGDCNAYPGKKKLILSGFHEAALAAHAIKEKLFPDQKVHLEYTTTSSRLLARLGV